jgi:hypothetical protein
LVRSRLEARHFIGAQLAAQLLVTYSTKPTKLTILAIEQSISVSKLLKPSTQQVDELFAHHQSFFALQSIFV